MTLVVKLGSSIVAADDGSLRTDVLDTVCEQVAELEGSGESIVMVTSGAIARGMRLLKLPVRPRAIDELQASSAVGQGDLFRAYESRLETGGVRAAQVLISAGDLWERVTYLNVRATLRRLLAWNVVPVVNENDTTATDEITVGDNDFLAALVAILLDARRLVLLTDVEGLFDADPRTDPSASLVRSVATAEALEGLEINDRTAVFGSGGMRSKTRAASMASHADIEAVICDGTEPGTLLGVERGDKVGTRFLARPRTESNFKLWLRFAKPVRGKVEVDSGAAVALRERGSSLLPVGITAVSGAFRAGDAVEVLHEGRAIGKGVAECSASELDEIKGMATNAFAGEVRERMGLETLEEAIHRDRFVLT